MNLQKAIGAAVVAMSLLAAAPAAAAQKFCGPEGTLEIDPTSVHYRPNDSTDKTKVVLNVLKTKLGIDTIIAARRGAAVMFVPDAQARYAVSYGFPQPKWQGWRTCD